MKRCRKCNQSKPLSEFYRYTDRRMQDRATQRRVSRAARTTADGYRGVCKACHNENRSRRRGARQGERRSAAEREGRQYRTLDEIREAGAERQRQRAEERARRRWAADARRERDRRWRWHPDTRHPGMSPDQARKKLNNAVRLGYVTRATECEECGQSATGYEIHAHHDDYEYPLRVRWLCVPCHLAEHPGEWGGARSVA